DEVARAERIYRGGDFRKVKLNHRPTRRRQDQNREASASQVLLVAQVLIGGDERVESRFRCIEQVAIFEFGPPHFVGGGSRMARQRVAQGHGRTLVKENLHWRRGAWHAPSGGS